MARHGCKTLLLYNRFNSFTNSYSYRNILSKAFAVYTPIKQLAFQDYTTRIWFCTTSHTFAYNQDHSGWLKCPGFRIKWDQHFIKYEGKYKMSINTNSRKYKFKYENRRCDGPVECSGDIWAIANCFVQTCLTRLGII